jgi:hypothetical protein
MEPHNGSTLTWVPTFAENIGLRRRQLIATNPLDYNFAEFIATIKSFIVQVPGNQKYYFYKRFFAVFSFHKI